jgi:hypothetical protein
MIWKRGSQKEIRIADEKLYFEDGNQCYYLWGKDGKPSILYHIKGDSTKYEDCLIYSVKANILPRPRDDFANCFLGLSKNNHLIRRDNLSGRLLNDIVLGKTYKFKYIDWQFRRKDIILRSAYSRKHGVDDKSILQAIIVMGIQPFRLKFMIELKKSVIGNDVTQANASENILTLRRKGGKVLMYSLTDLLDLNNRLCSCQLGQDCERKHGLIGCCINGIPITHDIRRLPPILFQVTSFAEVFFGGFPFHYITQTSKIGTFNVVDIASGQEFSETVHIRDTTHPDKCYFHSDNSGRIIYESAHAVHVYKFNTDDANTRRGPIRLQFCMTGNKRLKESEETSDVPSTSTRPRRSCAHCRFVYPQSASLFQKTVFCLNFDYKLQLLNILATNFESDKGFVIMYDSITGKMLREISLGQRLFEVSNLIFITCHISPNIFFCDF